MGATTERVSVNGIELASIALAIHFLRKRKSASLYVVGEDAAIVARPIARGRSHHGTAPLLST